MPSILYIGMDVHTTNYTVCSYDMEKDEIFGEVVLKPDYKEILKYLNRISSRRGGGFHFICGYEAGCLGYSLYHQLTAHGVECVILAPSTIPSAPRHQKNDRRDAKQISKCLAYHTYSPVYVPDEEDDAVKEYIRMRENCAAELKRVKQQIIALCNRHGKLYEGKNYWTKKHEDWLDKLEIGHSIVRETLDEYLMRYYALREKVAVYDARIEELSHMPRYEESVKKLVCIKGIATHTAMSAIVEIGDFKRFKKASDFASYLGLVPGERSSGEHRQHTGITKAGNSHLRRLLTEAAQGYSRGKPGKKSRTIKARQEGTSQQVIAYADKANERLGRKYIRIALRSRSNIAKTAVARELACFIWGMMTENYA